MKYLIPLIALLLVACGPSEPAKDYTDLAKCLTEQGVEMYGAFWCPHCAKVKKKFGPAFEHVNYVECDPRPEDSQTDKCLEKEIQEYATFMKPDGEIYPSAEPTPEQLAEWTGCPVGR